MNFYGDYGDEMVLSYIHLKFPIMVCIAPKRFSEELRDAHQWLRNHFGPPANWSFEIFNCHKLGEIPLSDRKKYFNKPDAFYDTYDHLIFFRECTDKVIEFKLIFG